MAINTIKLKKYSDVIIEKLAGGTIMPGALLLLNSSDAVVVHNDDAPANCLPLFALEDELQGKTINDTYASGDPVQCWVATRGEVVYAIVEDGTHVNIGDFLESAGTGGYLQAYTSGKVVGIALEHIDLSGSSGEEDSVSPLGYAKRLKIMVV